MALGTRLKWTLRWFVVTSIVLPIALVGGVLVRAELYGRLYPLSPDETFAGFVIHSLIFGALVGAFVGLAQQVLLARMGARVRWWGPATALAWALGPMLFVGALMPVLSRIPPARGFVEALAFFAGSFYLFPFVLPAFEPASGGIIAGFIQ